MFNKIIFFLFFSCSFLFANINNVFDIQAKMLDNIGLNLEFNIDKKAYLYSDKIKIKLLSQDKDITEFLNFPQSKQYKNYQIYSGKFDVLIPLGLINNLDEFSLRVDYLGCAYDGFCYEPLAKKIDVKKNANIYEISTSQIDLKQFSTPKDIKTDKSGNSSNHQNIAGNLSKNSVFVSLITFFGYGLLLALTPCILPMIPILSSIIVSKGDVGKKHSFIISLVYVFSMSIAYTIAGVLASLFGMGIQGILQIPFVIISFSLIFVFFALSMFGVFKFQMPLFIQNFINSKTENKTGFFGVVIMGFLSALIVGPCIAAPLAGALLFIAQSGNILLGGLALFVMSFAMGIPLLLIGLGGKRFLPKPGIWMEEINKLFGFIMLIMAAWMLSRIINQNMTMLIYGVIGIFFTIFMGGLDRAKSTFMKFKKSICIFVFIYSTLLITGFASGATDVSKPLQNIISQKNNNTMDNKEISFKYAKNLKELKDIIHSSKKPVMIDFWATWCVNCKELENVFQDDEVKKKLFEFELVKIDVTNSNNDNKEMMKEFAVYGPPALIFFKDGVELKNKQIVGLITAKDFLQHIKEI
ncbi:thiol:disulfide interchange protein DsbD [Campylobacter sputorum bv. paraureolyticus LMG 11764]|uniref:protein-disulfide reductase DsbD n=1 Tax=Campylobacter sputorum TaxID=206 RepID=UPI000B79417F|nr:protein-disulfide reductase DsbD [Campylobacter sputorum]ASM38718.1 thiol:disulfide interchange protein DsbD [Campylobacter sputorum bv. paraureolyticus LMG 11764]